MSFARLAIGVVLAGSVGHSLAGPTDGEVTPKVWQAARPRAPVPGAPHSSDVIMRSLERHPLNARDPHDTFRAAREFHVTRLEWCFGLDRDYVRRAKELGLTVGGTMTSAEPDSKGSMDAGRVTGKDGQPKTHPWFPAGRWVGCVNSPEYRAAWLDHARRYVDAGVDLLQQDDPHMVLRCTSPCYCEHCATAYALYQREHGDGASYEQFQKDRVRAFHASMHQKLDAHAGRHIPFSHNNLVGLRGTLDWTSPEFDFVEAEIDARQLRPASLHRMVAAAGGVPLVFQLRDTSVINNRRAMATLYALGAWVMVPWDIYLPNHAPRYFGKPEDFADLSGFIRATSVYLDGYEEAAVAGPGITEMRYGAVPPITVEGGSGQTLALVRARPDRPDAPIAVHLVDWADSPQPTTIRLRTGCFTARDRVSAKLFLPPTYDRESHRVAQESGDFSGLVRQVTMPSSRSEGSTVLTIPALNPWGLLVIQPE